MDSDGIPQCSGRLAATKGARRADLIGIEALVAIGIRLSEPDNYTTRFLINHRHDLNLLTTDNTYAIAYRMPHLASQQKIESDRSVLGNVFGEGAQIHQGDVYYPGQRFHSYLTVAAVSELHEQQRRDCRSMSPLQQRSAANSPSRLISHPIRSAIVTCSYHPRVRWDGMGQLAALNFDKNA